MIPEITNILPVVGELEKRLDNLPKTSPLPGPAIQVPKNSYKVDPTLIEKSPWIYKLNCVKHNREILHNPGSADLEVFVKRTINEPLKIGHILKMRRLDGGHDTYRVFTKIASDGLVSYALKPDQKELPPLIVFRCTEPDLSKDASLESIQNDLNSRIGERGWNAAKKHFEELMKNPNFKEPGKKVHVAGYSLGGLHAALFTGKFHRDVAHFISYSAPSMSGDLAKKFAEEINKSERDNPLIIQIHRTRGDPCHLAGEKQLGWGVQSKNAKVQLLEAVLPESQEFNLDHHSKLIFVQENDFTILEKADPNLLLNELDNLSSYRGPLIEVTRKIFGPILSQGLNAVEKLSKQINMLQKAILRPWKKSLATRDPRYYTIHTRPPN